MPNYIMPLTAVISHMVALSFYFRARRRLVPELKDLLELVEFAESYPFPSRIDEFRASVARLRKEVRTINLMALAAVIMLMACLLLLLLSDAGRTLLHS